MIRIHYTISLKSYLNHANGERDLFVNTDIATDLVGLPLISGRAIKGLLRESMEETLERMGEKNTEINAVISRFFGKGGYDRSTNALKFVSNAVIADYENTFLELYDSPFSPHEVKAYYTQILSQTKINKEKGTAENGSLRFTRVIDFLKQPTLHFYIDSNENLEQSKLFQSTLLNLRQSGVNRNRGWGRICVEQTSLEHLSESKKLQEEGAVVTTELKLLSPVLLPKPIGDQNTSYTENCIRGNLLLGALAYSYLDSGNTPDTDFLDAFVFGGLIFDNLTKNGAKKLPKILSTDKYDTKHTVVNASHFYHKKLAQNKGAVLKNIDGFYAKKQKVEIDKMFAFHISRNNNRLAGSSTKKEGAIFYYEYLVPFQTFKGKITETKLGLLNRIISKIGTKIQLSIGASKSTQYGQVALQMKYLPHSNKKNTCFSKNKPYYLVLESPCLVYNKNGFPSLDVEDFKSYLPCGIAIRAVETKGEFSQRFNGQWKSKTPRVNVWAAGSTFLLSANSEVLNFPKRIGEESHTGLGNYAIYTAFEMEALINALNADHTIKKEGGTHQSYTTKMVKEIAEYHKKIKIEKTYERVALKYVVKGGKVPNSLLFRLKQKLATSESFKLWIDKVRQKIAGQTLKNAGWYEPLLEGKKLKNGAFLEFQMKWFEIIKQQRFVNKQKDKSHAPKQ